MSAATAATCRDRNTSRPVRRLVFQLGGEAVAFESDDYAWLAYVHERVGSAPAAGADPFVVRRARVTAGRDDARTILRGDGFTVALDCASRRAEVDGVRAEAGTDALIELLAARHCDHAAAG
jgi:hypothetical protein